MNLFIRLVLTVIRASIAAQITRTQKTTISVRVWPNDLDFNMHLTNARFLSLMDLGRIDNVVRLGIVSTLRKRGWFPVVGGASITYYKSLKLFEKAELTTQIVGWDEKWIYIVQDLRKGDKLIASSACKTLFQSKQGAVPIAKLSETLGMKVASPEIPSEIQSSLASL